MKAVSFLSLLPADVSCNKNTPTAEFSQPGILQPGVLTTRGLTTSGLPIRGYFN